MRDDLRTVLAGGARCTTGEVHLLCKEGLREDGVALRSACLDRV